MVGRKPVAMSVSNTVQLIIACKHSCSCHAQKDVCRDSSKKSRKTFLMDYLTECMNCITILKWLPGCKHHPSPQSIKWIGTYPGNSGHAPPQEKASKEIPLKRPNQNKRLRCVIYPKVQTTVQSDPNN
uniref:Uncharacterized protein n=1 Tax=Opuntia streptacantha TaxID=393608 RepID=A0A7C9DMB1_OPUST